MNKQAEPVTVKGTGKVNVFGMSLRWRGRKSNKNREIPTP